MLYPNCTRNHAITYTNNGFDDIANYLSEGLERIQKHALGIIFPHLNYEEALCRGGIGALFTHHNNICEKLFQLITTDSNHNLHHLLPPRHNPTHDLRFNKLFHIRPYYKTMRFYNSFFIVHVARFRNVV